MWSLPGPFSGRVTFPGIKTLPVFQQRGITIAWNPTYYDFPPESFSLSDATSSTSILPAPFLAIGLREFLSQWCNSVYGHGLEDMIECRSETDAMNACKHGLGVMIFPGDAEERMKLRRAGLEVVRSSGFLLPKAFTFGIRYRADEQNPQILAAVGRLSRHLKGA